VTTDFSPSLWIRHTRTRYVAMLGLYMVEIERVGVRWHTTMSSIITGEVKTTETRSPLSIAIQQAEKIASEHSDAHTKKEQ